MPMVVGLVNRASPRWSIPGGVRSHDGASSENSHKMSVVPERGRATLFLRGATMRRITLLGLALVLFPAAGAAQARPGRDTTPIIFTVSGGISRGAYQGGLNWGLVEIARRSTYDAAFRERLRALIGGDTVQYKIPKLFLAAVAGASAGNINGLLSAIEWCRKRQATVPEQSVF